MSEKHDFSKPTKARSFDKFDLIIFFKNYKKFNFRVYFSDSLARSSESGFLRTSGEIVIRLKSIVLTPSISDKGQPADSPFIRYLNSLCLSNSGSFPRLRQAHGRPEDPDHSHSRFSPAKTSAAPSFQHSLPADVIDEDSYSCPSRQPNRRRLRAVRQTADSSL
ncbi:hypothetical protein SAMN04488090_3060 [Siphonobacter aquaeclarae]|uniref:Uncharacterized protein n=1 Tax=Siphonobacter aquaeclarae TaxID=563176 RepID=A0A1G9RV81_9BACT|nr:hypothetical protein SAMN04488090_3060 [Siphonobacter aquaeclarae]